MSEAEASHFSIQEIAQSAERDDLLKHALESVDSDPEQAARNLWFQVHNGHGTERFQIAVPLLRRLGDYPEHRGIAVELLGYVHQRSVEAADEAETAVRGILRTKRS